MVDYWKPHKLYKNIEWIKAHYPGYQSAPQAIASVYHWGKKEKNLQENSNHILQVSKINSQNR